MTKDYFIGIGKFQDNCFRTDFERENLFYSNGIDKFLNALVYPRQGFLEGLFNSSRDTFVLISKKELLDDMTKFRLAENIESAEKTLDKLKRNIYHIPTKTTPFGVIRFLTIREKTNSNGDKGYELRIHNQGLCAR